MSLVVSLIAFLVEGDLLRWRGCELLEGTKGNIMHFLQFCTCMLCEENEVYTLEIEIALHPWTAKIVSIPPPWLGARQCRFVSTLGSLCVCTGSILCIESILVNKSCSLCLCARK